MLAFDRTMKHGTHMSLGTWLATRCYHVTASTLVQTAPGRLQIQGESAAILGSARKGTVGETLRCPQQQDASQQWVFRPKSLYCRGTTTKRYLETMLSMPPHQSLLRPAIHSRPTLAETSDDHRLLWLLEVAYKVFKGQFRAI